MTSSASKCLISKNLAYELSSERFIILFGTCAFILAVTVFEIAVIFRQVFHGLIFHLNCAFAIYLTFNIIGNLIVCSQVDSSISLIKKMVAGSLEKPYTWQFCEKCNVMTPPRSEHCDDCNICILKKLHHWFVTGRCVGHYNYRYFMVFLGYVAIATVYATSVNIIYIWWLHPQIYSDFYRIICFVFPGFIFLQWTWNETGLSFDWNSIPIIVFLINAIAFLIVITILYFHIQNLLTGASSNENEKRLHDLGSLRRNAEMTFGKNFYRAWLSPFIASKLPHDGIHWSPALEDVAIKEL